MSTAEEMAAKRGDFLPEPVVEAIADEPVVEEVVEEAAAEPEAKAEPEVKERDESGKFIPKGRFDEAVNKERGRAEVAERKLAELQATLQQVDRNASTEKLEAEIVGLEQQHAKLLLDGDHEKAAETMGQIRLKERSIAIQAATNVTAAVKNEMREELREDTAIESLEATYDALNPQHADYDEGLVDDVLGWKSIFMSRDRMTPSAALIAAAKKVMAPLQKTAEAAPEKGLAAGKVVADRKAEQVARNIAAAKQQPASMKDAGIDSDKAGVKGQIDYKKLTPDERAALPETTRARLRGDML